MYSKQTALVSNQTYPTRDLTDDEREFLIVLVEMSALLSLGYNPEAALVQHFIHLDDVLYIFGSHERRRLHLAFKRTVLRVTPMTISRDGWLAQYGAYDDGMQYSQVDCSNRELRALQIERAEEDVLIARMRYKIEQSSSARNDLNVEVSYLESLTSE